MPKEKDSFREYVEFLQNNKWKCNFCNKEYGGSVTRIKAHLAGVGGYGIHGCNIVNSEVRSEAQKALKGKGPVELRNGPEGNALGSSHPRCISPSITQGPHQPVTVSDEDACRETSFTAIPNPSFDVISAVGIGSSASIPLHETNVPSQSLLAQNMISQRDFSSDTQHPQSQVGDSIQPGNLSYPSSSGDLASEALINMPGPVNAEDGEPNTEVPQDVRTDDLLVDSRPTGCGLVDQNTPTLKRKLEELSNREADMDELEAWCRKAERIKGEYWSMVQAYREGRSLAPQQIKRVDDFSKEVEDILGHFSFRKGSTAHAAGCRKSSPLVTTELVGENSEETIEKICAYLMKDEIFIIGICGMRGIGKTAILVHVLNRILENLAFNDVFWITVPHNFSVYKLQDEIANAVGLENLSKDKDVKRRACILNRHLKDKRAVLILDDLWMHFEVEDVGIPNEKGGLKLVLTTTSLDVCHKMLCQKRIKIDLLDKCDSWSLFEQKLCFGGELPLEIEEIAQSILNKCEGLPLGIIEIATRMRGIREVHEWKGMLWKLTNLKVELDIFRRLKLDYKNLGDSQVQQCFLHLIFCFKYQGFCPNHTKLIESFIDEGLLGGNCTRQELHDQGYTILDKLRKGCLWDHIEEEEDNEEEEEEDYSVPHPLIRGMALHIVKSTTHMVKAYMGLKEIPKEEFWTYHLEKVFLQDNHIQEIPYGISPNCPKLTRLSLNDNASLEAIHESFFTHLKGLKVLDLSNTAITKLPNPTTHLESLEALLLRRCRKLYFIPTVRKLGSLKKLDLNGCVMLEEVPEGMEMLVKLTYLDLVDTMINTLPEGVLRNLVNLQYLAIHRLRVSEEVKLKKVEALYCYVPNFEIFNACVRFLEQNSSQRYQLELNKSKYYLCRHPSERSIIIKSCYSIATREQKNIIGDGHALLPKNVEVLKVGQCSKLISLCKVGPLKNLKELKIEEWEKLEELGAVHFPRLRKLKIISCSKLKHLQKEMKEMQWLPCLQWFEIEDSEELEGINIAAPSLENIVVKRCPKMKRVVEWEWLATPIPGKWTDLEWEWLAPRLPNLKLITVHDCEKLEEIIVGPMPSGTTCLLTKFTMIRCNNMRVLLTHDMLLHLPLLQEIRVQECKVVEVIIGHVLNMTHSSIPSLTHLFLKNLPELKRICDGTMNCVSIQCIDISKCPKLRRISLQLPQLDNGLPAPPLSLGRIWMDQQTWNSLEWEQPFARSSLRPLVEFYEPRKVEDFNRSNSKGHSIIESWDTFAERLDGEIGGDGGNLVLKNVQVLKVERGSGVTSLSELGPLENLEDLTIEEWEKLEELGAIHFPRLQKLNIIGCFKLKHLLVEGQGLPCLEQFNIEGSEELMEINIAAPILYRIEVFGCSKMERVMEWEWLTTYLPKIKYIKIENCVKLKEIIGGPMPSGATCLLEELEIKECNSMRVPLTLDMLSHLSRLTEIKVEDCKGIEMITGTFANMTHSFPYLIKLRLLNLPELKRICDGTMSCVSIQYINISKCPKLKRIALQLPLLDNGSPSPPPFLKDIWINQRTWESLEWDDPQASSSLQHLVKFCD